MTRPTPLQRRILHAVLDMHDHGDTAVTVSDLRHALSKQADAPSEAIIESSLRELSVVQRVKPIVLLSPEAREMLRRPAPVVVEAPAAPVVPVVAPEPVVEPEPPVDESAMEPVSLVVEAVEAVAAVEAPPVVEPEVEQAEVEQVEVEQVEPTPVESPDRPVASATSRTPPWAPMPQELRLGLILRVLAAHPEGLTGAQFRELTGRDMSSALSRAASRGEIRGEVRPPRDVIHYFPVEHVVPPPLRKTLNSGSVEPAAPDATAQDVDSGAIPSPTEPDTTYQIVDGKMARRPNESVASLVRRYLIARGITGSTAGEADLALDCSTAPSLSAMVAKQEVVAFSPFRQSSRFRVRYWMAQHAPVARHIAMLQDVQLALNAAPNETALDAAVRVANEIAEARALLGAVGGASLPDAIERLRRAHGDALSHVQGVLEKAETNARTAADSLRFLTVHRDGLETELRVERQRSAALAHEVTRLTAVLRERQSSPDPAPVPAPDPAPDPTPGPASDPSHPLDINAPEFRSLPSEAAEMLGRAFHALAGVMACGVQLKVTIDTRST